MKMHITDVYRQLQSAHIKHTNWLPHTVVIKSLKKNHYICCTSIADGDLAHCGLDI